MAPRGRGEREAGYHGGVGDRANKFIGLLSERYTGLSPGSRAPRESRGTTRERWRVGERQGARQGDSRERAELEKS